MRLILHIVRKDFLAFRRPLALLATAVALKLVVGVIAYLDPQAAEQSYREFLAILANLSIGLEVLITWMLVAFMFHEDSVAGGASFWRARPISRFRLFAAKALGALILLGGIPAAVSLPWWLYCGLGPSDIALAASETVLWQMVIAATAFGLAATTRTLKGFLGATLALAVVALVATSFVLLGLRTSSGSSMNLERLLSTRFEPLTIIASGHGLAYSRLGVIAALIIVGSLAVAVCQTLALRRIISAKLVAVLLALLAAVTQLWPWDGMPLLLPSEGSALARNTNLTFRMAKADPVDLALGDFRLDARFWVGGIPEGYRLAVSSSSGLVQWNDGTIHRQVGVNSTHYLGLDLRPSFGIPALTDRERMHIVTRRQISTPGDARMSLTEQVLGYWNLESFNPGKRKLNFSLGGIGDEGLARFHRELPDYLLSVVFRLERPERMGETKLAEGASLTGGDGRSRIERLTIGSDRSIQVQVCGARPTPIWNDFRNAAPGAEISGRWEDEYWLADPASRRAASGFGSVGRVLRIATVSIFRANPRFDDSDNFPVLPAEPSEWWKRLKFVGVRYRTVESFFREHKVEQIPTSNLPASLTKYQQGKTQFLGRVHITGEVRKPGHSLAIEVPRPIPWRAIGALRPAGGLLDTADASRVHIIRKKADGTTEIIPVDLPGYFEGRVDEMDSPLLEPGDIVHVPALTQ